MKFFNKKKPKGRGIGIAKGKIPEKRKREKKEEFVSAFDDDDEENGQESEIGLGQGQGQGQVTGYEEEFTGDEDLKDVNEFKKKKGNSGGFQSFSLSPQILKAVMKRGYKVPTPIQRKTIPLILEGKDVVGMARTGSGKTAAFLLPLLEKLMTSKSRIGQEIKYPRGLILSPTRELATQTVKFFRELGKFLDLKCVAILGGDSMESQFSALHDKPDVVIATPGRFMHLCVEMELRLDGVEYVVFDEADRLFEMGFGEQLSEILSRLSEKRQTILFSATLPRVLVDFAKAGLHNPALIRLDVESKLPETLALSYLACRSEDKVATLLYLIKNEIYERDQTIIFVATKHHVEYLHAILDIANVSNSYIYSSLDASARKISLGKFRNGISNVLIVTDIAARGIDIPILDNVINFHFPSKPKLFMHRVGRVARAGRSGTAYSIVAPDEVAFLFDLHLFLGRPLRFTLAEEESKKESAFVGRIPQDLLDEEHSFLRTIAETKTDLMTMSKVCKNGYGQYLKSRPNASSDSNKRAKEVIVSNLPIHPMFGKIFNDDPMNTLINQMQTYRPRSTIFEIGPKAGSETFKIMQQKRTRDQRVVEKHRNSKQAGSKMDEEDSEQPVKVGTKDEENFISYLPKDHHTEAGLSVGTTSFERQIQESVLDLTVDDSKLLKSQKSSLKWDRKRKKFVHTGTGHEDKKGKKIKTESGRWISSSYKSDRYNTWKEKSKFSSVADDGDSDMEVGENGADKSRGHGNRNISRGGAPGPKAPRGRRIRSELKRPEEILKIRKQKEMNERKQKGGKGKKKNHRLKSGSSSGGRGGRGSGFGGRGGRGGRGGGGGGRGGRGGGRGRN